MTTGKTFGLAGYIGGTTKTGTTPKAAPFHLAPTATTKAPAPATAPALVVVRFT